MKCRKCLSDNIRFTKHIHSGKDGETYHYKLWCDDCFVNYHVTRNKEVYEFVKDQKWIFKKESDLLTKQAKKNRRRKIKKNQPTLF